MHSGGKSEEGASEQPKMDYLSVKRNEADNQLTVSSVTSGNLALYEVGKGLNGAIRLQVFIDHLFYCIKLCN